MKSWYLPRNRLDASDGRREGRMTHMHVPVEVGLDIFGERYVFSRDIPFYWKNCLPLLPLASSQQHALYGRRRRVGARSMVPKQAGGQEVLHRQMPSEPIHMPVQRIVLPVCGRLVSWIGTTVLRSQPAFPFEFVDAVSTRYTVRSTRTTALEEYPSMRGINKV